MHPFSPEASFPFRPIITARDTGDSFALLQAISETLNRLLDQLARTTAIAGGLQPECLSIEDAAKFLGVGVPTVEHLIRTRQIAYVQLGSQRGRVIPVSALRELIATKLQPTCEELLRRRKRR
jgi:excisionase family DNA binding protein